MKRFLLLSVWMLCGFIAPAQKIRAYLNANKLTTDDVLQFSVELSGGGGQVSYPPFPEIKGFTSGAISTSQQMSFGYGQNMSVFTFTRSYFPNQTGVFTIPSFQYSAMGVSYQSPVFSVEVTKGGGRPNAGNQGFNPYGGFRDPFQDYMNGFFGRPQQPRDLQYQETQADYFMSIQLDKNECYVGEQVSGEVSLFINERDFGKIQVDGRAIGEMQQRIKNKDFWEEIIEFRQIPSEQVVVNGKRYIRYTLYRTILFPLHEGDFGFRDVWMDAKKLYVATNLHPFDRMMGVGNKFEPIKIRAADRLVHVKPLPPTNLANAFSVGKFSISTSLKNEKVKTGEPIELEVKIRGNGNITLIPPPATAVIPGFENFDVASSYSIHKTETALYGEKDFQYVFVPSAAGEYNLGPVKFYYFNPAERHYDSLLVDYIPVKVEGENLQNLKVKSGTLDGFYRDHLEQASDRNDLLPLPGKWTFFAFLGLLSFSVIAGIRMRKKQS